MKNIYDTIYMHSKPLHNYYPKTVIGDVEGQSILCRLERQEHDKPEGHRGGSKAARMRSVATMQKNICNSYIYVYESCTY